MYMYCGHLVRGPLNDIIISSSKIQGFLIIRTKLKCMTPNLLLVHVCMYSVHLCLDMFSFEFSLNCVENNCNVQVSLVCMVEMQNSTSYFMYHILIISHETII